MIASDSDFFEELADTGPAHPSIRPRENTAAIPISPSKSILQGEQELARLSSQPDRLVAVRAAVSPLFEAAGSPLNALSVLARMQGQLGMARADKLHRQLVSEIASFQSVCQDARLRYERIVSASYALCTALDEAACHALAGDDGRPADASAWMARSLAVHFHADSKGGTNVFLIIGRLVAEPQEHIDLLELMFVILQLGFEGIYRRTINGRRELENIHHRVHDLVSGCRKNSSSEFLIHWQQVQHFIREPSPTLEHPWEPS